LPDTSRHGLFPKTTLDAGELTAIRTLADLCEQHDDIDLRLVWNALESRSGERINDFLYYADGQLVGFLTLSGLGDHEAEATGMVHPNLRRRGIFRELVGAARMECRRNGTEAIVFTADRRSLAAKGFLESLGAQHQFAEHRMRLDTPMVAQLPASELTVARGTAADAALIATIIATDAGFDPTNFGQHVAATMRQPTYRYYIARLHEAPVGTANIQILNGDAYIYGFVVNAEFRGRGYGRQILAYMIAEIAAERPQPVFLEVETDNAPALALYHSFGFRITNTFDYYRIDVAHA
jgi:ribosomal protein S18 acetylase RimI-like enzyme